MRITIKIGSNVLTREDGSLDFTRMSALVDQIATLRQMGHEIILVSSGAVASGRSELKHIQENLDSVDQRQLFSAVGQAKLINRYFELFREYGISVGQVLTTKENFLDAEHLRNQANCMRVMLENRVLPIVNENDTVSITELMFTDNDELSGLIAEMTKSQCLIILSNIDGFYTGNPSESDSHLIRVVSRNRKRQVWNLHSLNPSASIKYFLLWQMRWKKIVRSFWRPMLRIFIEWIPRILFMTDCV